MRDNEAPRATGRLGSWCERLECVYEPTTVSWRRLSVVVFPCVGVRGYPVCTLPSVATLVVAKIYRTDYRPIVFIFVSPDKVYGTACVAFGRVC